MPKQFTLRQLFALTAGVALVLGLAQANLWVAMAICPAVMGAIVGHWRVGDRAGVMPGILSAFYWSLLMTPVFLAVAIVVLSGFFPALMKTLQPPAIILCHIPAGMIGGYIGGEVELAAARHRAERAGRPPGAL
jgi:uncharacterized BrkB/YihY/UPF0761 family membrane protein